jgi:hypothetical protein
VAFHPRLEDEGAEKFPQNQQLFRKRSGTKIGFGSIEREYFAPENSQLYPEEIEVSHRS